MQLSRTHASFLLAFLLFLTFTSPAAAQRKKDRDNEQKEKAETTGDTLSERELREAEYLFVEGEKYFLLEDYAKAYALFKKALEVNEENAAVHFKIAEALIRSDQPEEALLYANRALELEKNNKYYYLLTAEIFARQGNFSSASTLLEQMLNKIPGTEEHNFELAGYYIFQKEFEKAIEAYNKAEEKYGISPELSLQKQKLYLQLSRLDDAVTEGDKLIEAFPGDVEFVLQQAELLMNNKRAEAALKYLSTYLDEYPEDPRARLLLADIYRKQGNVEAAQKNLLIAFGDDAIPLESKLPALAGYINKATTDTASANMAMKLAGKIIEAHPEDPKAYAVQGDLHYALEEKEQALTNYLEAAKLEESNFNVWQNILSIQYELGKYDSLIASSEEALEYFPNQASFYFFNGSAYLIKKDYKAASYSLEQGKRLSGTEPRLLSIFNSQLGDAYYWLGEYGKSDNAYQAALDFDPGNDHVLNNYSYYLSLRKEKLDLAYKMSKDLVERNPDNPTFLDTHAWVLYTKGNYKEAKKYLERALGSENKDAISGEIIEHYGDVLFKLGEVEKAVIQWQKAKGMDESSDLIDKKIADRKLYE